MESIAYYTFWAGFILASVSSLLYAFHAVGSWTATRAAATNAGTIAIPVQVSLPRGVGTAASLLALSALGVLAVSIAFRTAAVERPPLGNLWEFTIAFGWGILLFTVLAERVFKQPAVSAIVMPVAVFMMLIAVLYFPHEVQPLVPALQANRILGIHVSVMLLAYSALAVSFGAAVLYLIQVRGAELRFSSLPDRETLEDVASWSVLIGFPLLTLGVALGAWWADKAWGRYWGWDPKETSALLTWLIYAFYLHARGLRGWSGHRLSWVLILGFGAVMFTYFAVNFLISGLHSYAGV